MAEKTHCDRCDRVIEMVSEIYDGGFIDLPGQGMDLCVHCQDALRSWIVDGPSSAKTTER